MAEAQGQSTGCLAQHAAGCPHAPVANAAGRAGRADSTGAAGAASSAGDRGAGPRGARFALAAAGVFLAPLGLAIAGGALVPGDAGRQGLGALAGLAVGVLAAGLIGRWVLPNAARRASSSSREPLASASRESGRTPTRAPLRSLPGEEAR